ncbi:hypothetical protein F5B22DRAFT_649358 [Xylaria bambusicola]|uniref:uncharacterized protein n=1 Tax=Xylaria bambusicola TaxID=326684 RepID=UPI002007C93A|nr:uncharacterized protein F5B22DRAFT_649358 [Xylaria bambusicola]KAI0509082.1 hypothetical protein F5B22DRAFT_649358 [Xylaria bambusicola]
MHFSTILSIFLAALVAAAPTTPPNDSTATNTDTYEPDLVTFVMTVPNCPAIKDYCTHCNGDFNCDTDPRCEWCYHNKQFGTDGGNSD